MNIQPKVKSSEMHVWVRGGKKRQDNTDNEGCNNYTNFATHRTREQLVEKACRKLSPFLQIVPKKPIRNTELRKQFRKSNGSQGVRNEA